LQLTPLYDLISTIYYKDLDQKMAMKLGGEYHIGKIIIANFDQLANEIGFAKPEVRKRILEIIDAILLSLPLIELQNKTEVEVAGLIKTRCEDFATHIKGINNKSR
jgi:hypothetical protein